MKKFNLTISVDEDKLKQSYLERQDLIEEDLPSIPDLIQQEFGWLEASGISLISEAIESQPPLSEFPILQTLSGNFLCQQVPDNWLDLTEEQQNQFVQEHIWQPLEYWDASEVITLIQDASESFITLLKQNHIRLGANQISSGDVIPRRGDNSLKVESKKEKVESFDSLLPTFYFLLPTLLGDHLGDNL